ncbi:uncharacterized protein LOC131881885 [Tigriopus californicus]|uniref:uncharacterized protein LOC131881885 n=1 Tax=Tigriopus californicus TaxID=6832 RepID=UPI0027DA57A7|nr:uncharacterized protein LOC131881885 [Tigriopus californicus]
MASTKTNGKSPLKSNAGGTPLLQSTMSCLELDPSSIAAATRSHSITTDRPATRELQCILEDGDPDIPSPDPGGQLVGPDGKEKPHMTPAQRKRASMVKKAIRYFEDKSNRSVSEDNLFTRRKNLAAHLGLDEKVSKKEVQKINTYCLPVPSSANSDTSDNMIKEILLVEEEDDEDLRSKNLVSFLGMKDGLTASIASQGTLCDDSPRSSIDTANATHAPSPGVSGAGVLGNNRGGRGGVLSRSASLASKSKEHVTFKL